MRIIIDLQGAQTESRYRGIGRYSLSLAKAIISNSGQHEVLIVLNGLFQDSIPYIRSELENLLPSENIHVWHALGPVNESDEKNQWHRETAELIREAFIQSLKPDVIHIPSFFEGYIDNAVTSIGLFDTYTPISVTILDLIPLLNAEQYLEPSLLYKQHYLRKIDQLKSATKLFAISESARQEALQNLPFTSQDVVHQSISIEPFFKILNINKQEYYVRRLALGISKPFVLYTGGADSRKNLPALIKAYAALSLELRAKHQLVFAGRIPEANIEQLRQLAEQAGLSPEELYFTGYISDSELVELYNLCELFVFPSWHEGFGLPVLEAMACGAPAIAANTSSLPEVIGIAEALFCPFSEFDMSNRIYSALTDIDYKKRLKENSLKQVDNFSWDIVAQNSIKSFEDMQSAHPISEYKSAETIYTEVSARIEASCPSDLSAEDRIKMTEVLNKLKCKPKNKTLFVDISELFQRDAATGIQRVTRSLLLELIRNPIDNYTTQPIYATPDKIGYYCANSYIKNNNLSDSIEYQNANHPISYKSGDIFLGLDLQHQVVIAQQDLLNEMRNDGVCISFVVYDLLPILMPHTFPEGVENVHKQWLTILADMDHLLCISRSVADELSTWLSSQEHIFKALPKISWFHLGADIESSIPSSGLPEQAEQALAKLMLQPSFLCVGTLEPRKGQSQVLDAFEILWEQNIEVSLALVGKQGWHVDDLINRIENHPEINNRLFWFDSISDEFLEHIYSNVSCLIAPSEGEGFGLPIIEAMKHNLPIIARDIPVFREVAGSAASYFLGTTGHVLFKKIQEFIHSNNFEKTTYSKTWLTWNDSSKNLKKLLTNKKGTKKVTVVREKTLKEAYILASKNIEMKDANRNYLSIKNHYKKLLKDKKLKEKYKSIKKNNKNLNKCLNNNNELLAEEQKKTIIVQDELIQSKETINQLRNSILIKDSLIDSLKSEISDKNMTIEQLNFIKVNSEKDFNIAQSKLSTEQERLGAITTSTSWRITYPVRLCVRTLRQGISILIKALQKIFVKNKK